MEYERAIEMVEALNSDNETAIITLGKFGDDVATALYNKIKELERSK